MAANMAFWRNSVLHRQRDEDNDKDKRREKKTKENTKR